ncbi:MAG TPA: M48 family metallopeptidase [Blastocatellia bacterium]|nr:M48 family metallopeptidase [Blastocatellia bacterium]
MKRIRNLSPIAALALSLVFAMPVGVLAQTHVVAPKNPFPVAKDVELGRQAAQQVGQRFPTLRDQEVQYYVERVGERLAESIPAEYQHREFRYTYTVVDIRDVNAFALPGGFTFVNRGLIETAQNEAQLAGVIAHEISHVALRHGTAQAAEAQKYQTGSVLGQILGAVIGGGAGQVISGASQMGAGVAFLRFSRAYERQADTLGAQIMANAGYDPRELANMFRILERQGGGGGPEFLSDHPNPGNRFEAINREAQMLRVENPVRRTNEFTAIQGRLRDLPRARSMEEVSRGGNRYPQNTRYPEDQRRQQLGRVEFPSSRFRTYSNSNLFRISVPDNWREMGNGDEITFAPEGAYGDYRGQSVFTHGVQVGVSNTGARNLRQATDQFISSLAQGNPNLRQNGSYRREYVGGREGLSITLGNVSEATGRSEVITVFTTMLRNGEIFYLIGVAPQDEYSVYQRTFQTIVRTLEING